MLGYAKHRQGFCREHTQTWSTTLFFNHVCLLSEVRSFYVVQPGRRPCRDQGQSTSAKARMSRLRAAQYVGTQLKRGHGIRILLEEEIRRPRSVRGSRLRMLETYRLHSKSLPSLIYRSKRSSHTSWARPPHAFGEQQTEVYIDACRLRFTNEDGPKAQIWSPLLCHNK